MRRMASRVVLAAVAIAVAVGGAPAAVAAGDATHGGCFLAAVQTNPALTGGRPNAMLGDVSTTTDVRGQPDLLDGLLQAGSERSRATDLPCRRH